jgi:erythromycin esterase
MFHCKNSFCLLFLFLFTSANFAQQYLNLDFEQPEGVPRIWFDGKGENYPAYENYEVLVDSNVSYSGEKSLRVSYQSFSNSPLLVTNRIPRDHVIGKHVCFSGYIKTDNVINGRAEIWWKNFTKNDDLSSRIFYQIEGWGPTGTTDWTKYIVEIDVDTSANKVLFGLALKCTGGTVWFDSLKVEIDGVNYEQELFVPTQDQINWLADNSVPFDSVDPNSDYSDLLPLGQIIGDAKIVILGEATHGTSEFFKIKHKITRYLAEVKGFNVFAMEDNISECRNINNFVRNDQGDVIQVIKNLWPMYRTQELAEMILWMQDYNLSGTKKMEFWGFDIQSPFVPADSVISFLERANPVSVVELINACNTYLSSLGNYLVAQENAEIVYNHLISNRHIYMQTIDSLEVDWAIKYADLMLTFAVWAPQFINNEIESFNNYRDKKMAENVDWILEHSPANTKIVLWMHNMHASKGEFSWEWGNFKMMGTLLRNKYGNDAISIGFGFHEGAYRGTHDNYNYNSFEAIPSGPGGVEWVFHNTGNERLILDLSKVSAGSPNSLWLKKRLELHGIGHDDREYQFYPLNITDMFDVFIFIDETNAARDPVDPSDLKLLDESVPRQYFLFQNYPNPFNPSTVIKYNIPVEVKSERSKVKNVTLVVYDILGREVATLVNEKQKPGNYEVIWDASEQSSGVYFYQIQAGEYIKTKKMILLR